MIFLNLKNIKKMFELSVRLISQSLYIPISNTKHRLLSDLFAPLT